MIKVNQVCSTCEAEWVRGVDIVGVCLGDAEQHGRRTVTREQFEEIKCATSASIALAIDESAEVSDKDLPDVIGSLRPNYYEFTPCDPEKSGAFERQLAVVRGVGVPGIANGFFLLKDEVSLVRRTAHLDRLVEAGVRFFQVEVDSLLDPRFRISSSHETMIADLFARYPFIVNDKFSHLNGPLDVNQAGLYLKYRQQGAQELRLFQPVLHPLSGREADQVRVGTLRL
ncbi:hypothetical protein [Streptomyces regalis]|uniref:Uncharacterized protein n=1 Tax=Streptomyces regalis TaxID=68262 RepID=A0A101J8G9_9ACTN|nr:hypothetical protein [Streptomyces regalis]KUL22156.1 hypothetical protein ADL12_42710 [Streptomyces regalis]